MAIDRSRADRQEAADPANFDDRIDEDDDDFGRKVRRAAEPDEAIDWDQPEIDFSSITRWYGRGRDKGVGNA